MSKNAEDPAERLAILFHERMNARSVEMGYDPTKIKEWNKDNSTGKLMIAVCRDILNMMDSGVKPDRGLFECPTCHRMFKMGTSHECRDSQGKRIGVTKGLGMSDEKDDGSGRDRFAQC